MAGFFDPRNNFWRMVSAVGDVCGLSLLWLLLCLPVVTIGPATAALYYAVTTCVRPMEPGAFKAFFHSLRQNLKQGILATLVVLLAAALCAVGWYSCWVLTQGQSWGMGVLIGYTILLLLVPVGTILYVFPLLARFEYKLGSLLRTAFCLALAHLPRTLLLLAVTVISAWLCWVFTLPLFFMPGVAALLYSLTLEKVFRRYSPELAAQEGDLEEEPEE